MKKKLIIIYIVLIVIIITLIYKQNNILVIKNTCVEKYVIGNKNIKGNVDIAKFESISKDFKICANKDGYAVFENPNKAFRTLKNKYKSGIKIINKQYHIGYLNTSNYNKYKIYGSQVVYETSDRQVIEALFISEFLDIYENSFN